jgi:hypothetical protein
VFDSLAAAADRLYFTTVDGRVVCYQAGERTGTTETGERRRRWYQSGLGALLVPALLLSLAFGWLAMRIKRAPKRR